MPKKHEEAPAYTAGDLVKNATDERMSTGMRGIWQRVRETGWSGFGKGVLLTAAIVIGVVALFSGFKGGNSDMSINGSLITTFENGLGHGISLALDFLTSGLGMVTMAVGGTLGVASNIMQDQRKQAALESERLAIEYQRMREQGKQHECEKAPEKSPEPKQPTPQVVHHHHHHHDRHRTVDKPVSSGIYEEGTLVKNSKFCAVELKRRTKVEAENNIAALSV